MTRTLDSDHESALENADRNQADLRNELLSQRGQYITPLKLLIPVKLMSVGLNTSSIII